VTKRADNSAAQPIHLLIVEDSSADYELLLGHLRNSGLVVNAQRVEDEAALRQALTQQAWDAILSDHQLPRFSAGAALAALKDLRIDLPFLIVSGTMAEDLAVQAMLAGADDYIDKRSLARLVPALLRSVEAARSRAKRREAETRLEQDRESLAAIAANMPGATFQIELDTESKALRLTSFSQGSIKLAGVTFEEMAHDVNLLFQVFHEPDAARLAAMLGNPPALDTSVEWEGRIHSRRLPVGERRARWFQVAASARQPSADKVIWEGVLMDITQQKRVQGMLTRSQQQLRELSVHAEKIRESERANIAREIHDDIGGTLTGMKVDLEWLRKHAAQVPGAAEKIEDMRQLLAAATAASSRIMLALHPSILDQGLVPAIDWQVRDFAKRLGLTGKFSYNREDVALDTERATALFRMLQEALTNVAKHAQATQVEVQLFDSASLLALEIRDDGVGIHRADQEKAGSFGIRGMRERVHNLGGWMDIGSAPGQGTTLMISVPHEGAEPEDLEW
jgi:two-component system, NarL family, sensor histidine kinase UhpB